MHHGIEGQKWGVRRFQNKDGTLTKEGLARRQKALKVAGKIGYTAANIATLGAIGRAKRAEDYRREHPVKNGVQFVTNSIYRSAAIRGAQVGSQLLREVGAMTAGTIYMAAGGNNPKLKRGLMTVGRIVNVMGNANVAITTAYQTHGLTSDYLDYRTQRNNSRNW